MNVCHLGGGVKGVQGMVPPTGCMGVGVARGPGVARPRLGPAGGVRGARRDQGGAGGRQRCQQAGPRWWKVGLKTV